MITRRRVAELLILRDDMPPSLHCCINFIHETIEQLSDARTRELERTSERSDRGARFGRMKAVEGSTASR